MDKKIELNENVAAKLLSHLPKGAVIREVYEAQDEYSYKQYDTRIKVVYEVDGKSFCTNLSKHDNGWLTKARRGSTG